MPAFAEDGTVTCPFPAAWLEFFNADKNNWTACAYKRPDCDASREHSHGTVVAALPDGSFPPVFLWDEISYRVIAKSATGEILATIDRVTPASEFVGAGVSEPASAAEARPHVPDPRDEELAALRARVTELESRDASVFASVIQEPERPRDDLLDFDADPAPEIDLTGDQLLDVFEQDEAVAAGLVQSLSATRQKHLSEQLNVEKARLRRERVVTDVANPREASIDRLLGLLTRRGEV